MSRNNNDHIGRCDTTTTVVDLRGNNNNNNGDNDDEHLPFHLRPTNVTHPNDTDQSSRHRRPNVPTFASFSSSSSSSSWWSFVWHQTIECWVHQILYHRHIYPRVTFSSQPPPPPPKAPRPEDFAYWNYHHLVVVADSSYCVWNQHPPVQSYIRRTLRTIVPSFVSGRANEVQLHVIQYYNVDNDHDDDNNNNHHHEVPPPGQTPTMTNHPPPPFHILETYTIRMTRHCNHDTPNTTTANDDGSNRNIHLPHSTLTNTEVIQQQQRIIEGMRQLIQVHIRTLEHPPRRRHDNHDDDHYSNPNRSFQLGLHVPPTTVQSNDGDNDDIHSALASGTWSRRFSSSSDNPADGHHHHHHDPSTTTHHQRKTIRPIYSYNEDQYIGIHIQCSVLHYSTAATPTT